MASALEIEAQPKAIGEILLRLRPRRRKLRQPHKPEEAKEYDDEDKNEFPSELGTHAVLPFSFGCCSAWNPAIALREIFTFTCSAMRNCTDSSSRPTIVP